MNYMADTDYERPAVLHFYETIDNPAATAQRAGLCCYLID